MIRRAKGDGGLSWDAARERWVASATIGYDGRGKRIVRRGRGTTKTEAKNKLRQLLRDLEDGLVVANEGYIVAQAVEDWLTYGLSNRDPATQEVNRHLCEKHVIPLLGARKLRDLKATEVDAWLTDLSTTLSTRTLQAIRSCLNRTVERAMARDRVRRNVVELTELPTGQRGRPSKALSPQQADDVLIKTAADRLHPYIVVSLLTGARTEELRALRWTHVHLEGRATATPPVPPIHRGVALGACDGRYQDATLKADACVTRSMHRRAPGAARPTGCRSAGRRAFVEGVGTGIRNGSGQ
ncbi:MAG: tyrosine-type recombinase/integrase [Propionibacteriaceae bacterium]|nr:tyrosine-type recombinase/integrase [Propionibacteriaceae bacterium]